MFSLLSMAAAAAAGAGGGGGGSQSFWNPSDKSANHVLSNDDKTVTQNNASESRNGIGSTTIKTSGAWYFEMHVDQVAGGAYWMTIGISPPGSDRASDLGQNADCYGYGKQGSKYFDGSFGGYSYATYATNDVIGVAFDIDNNTIEFFKNNSSQGEESVTLNSGTGYVAAAVTNNNTAALTLRSLTEEFTYSVPAGFTALGE